MQQLSEMEKLNLLEILREERVCAAKCEAYLQQCLDQSLRGIFQQMANTSRHHEQMITQLLSAGGIPTNLQ